MKVVTSQFGEIEYSTDQVIRFDNGVIGFESSREFLILKDKEYEPFCWLVSANGEDVGFPVLDPFLAVADYGKDLPKGLVKRVLAADEDLDLFCVVTFRGENGQVTINLRSPIVIDNQNKTGEQRILASEGIPVAHPLS
ncbi:MAG: flagellar assembly protein FliW [Calditrichia bacterium]